MRSEILTAQAEARAGEIELLTSEFARLLRVLEAREINAFMFLRIVEELARHDDIDRLLRYCIEVSQQGARKTQ